MTAINKQITFLAGTICSAIRRHLWRWARKLAKKTQSQHCIIGWGLGPGYGACRLQQWRDKTKAKAKVLACWFTRIQQTALLKPDLGFGHWYGIGHRASGISAGRGGWHAHIECTGWVGATLLCADTSVWLDLNICAMTWIRRRYAGNFIEIET